MALGKQIKKYREFLEWTLDVLSLRSGVDVGTISALENRDSTRSQYAPQIAKAFGISFEQLVDEQTDWSSVVATMVISTEVREREATYQLHNTPWPFKNLMPEEWNTLDSTEKARIEAYAQGVLESGNVIDKSTPSSTEKGFSARVRFPKQ